MKQILIIDTDIDLINSLAEQLNAAGYDVIAQQDAQSGIALATEADLIILAVELPDQNGFGVCSVLKRDPVTAHIPIFITSSETTTTAFEKHLNLATHADGYFLKPINVPALIQQANAIFAQIDAMAVAAAEAQDQMQEAAEVAASLPQQVHDDAMPSSPGEPDVKALALDDMSLFEDFTADSFDDAFDDVSDLPDADIAAALDDPADVGDVKFVPDAVPDAPVAAPAPAPAAPAAPAVPPIPARVSTPAAPAVPGKLPPRPAGLPPTPPPPRVPPIGAHTAPGGAKPPLPGQKMGIGLPKPPQIPLPVASQPVANADAAPAPEVSAPAAAPEVSAPAAAASEVAAPAAPEVAAPVAPAAPEVAAPAAPEVAPVPAHVPVAQIDERVAQLEAQYRDAMETIAGLRAQLAAANDELAAVKEQLAAVNAQLDTANENIRIANATIDEANVQTSASNETITALSHDNAVLQENLQTLANAYTQKIEAVQAIAQQLFALVQEE